MLHFLLLVTIHHLVSSIPTVVVMGQHIDCANTFPCECMFLAVRLGFHIFTPLPHSDHSKPLPVDIHLQALQTSALG